MKCPVCGGKGECEREARPMRVGMNRWIEYGCRCCQATGHTTEQRVEDYHANRRRDAVEAWRREELRRQVEQRERELAEMEAAA